MQEKKEILLLEKNTIRISKTQNEEYHMQCEIENKNLILEKIIDFEMMKLIYDLNKDVYEKTELYKNRLKIDCLKLDKDCCHVVLYLSFLQYFSPPTYRFQPIF